MRKAKIMLSTLVLVFAVFTLLASKMSNFSQNVVYTGKLNSGVCTTAVSFRVIITGTPNLDASTTSLAFGCTPSRVSIVDFDN